MARRRPGGAVLADVDGDPRRHEPPLERARPERGLHLSALARRAALEGEVGAGRGGRRGGRGVREGQPRCEASAEEGRPNGPRTRSTLTRDRAHASGLRASPVSGGFSAAAAQRGERIGDLEPARAEAVERRGAAAGAAGIAPPARRLEHVPSQEHPLQVRRRDLVAERRDVEIAQLGDRERPAARARRRRSCTRACRAAARGRRGRARRGRRRAGAARRPGATRCPTGAAGSTSAGTSPR